jgi:hypothetical protein
VARATDAWIADEPRFASVARDVLARAARQPWRVLGAAAVATLLVVGFRLTRRPLHVATLAMRVVEGTVQDRRAAPRLPSAIRDHVLAIALNRTQIIALMARYGFRPRPGVDVATAADELRTDIGVIVSRNRFLLHGDGSEPRSATVELSFPAYDAALARAFVHELGALVAADQAAARATPLERARALHDAELRSAEDELRALQQASAALELRAVRGGAAELLADRVALEREAARALARIRQLDQRAAELDLAGVAEEQQLGLAFEIVDEDVQTLRAPLSRARLALLSLATFAGATLVSAIVLGAFDRRIHRAADLAAHGIPCLGTVRRLRAADEVVARAAR